MKKFFLNGDKYEGELKDDEPHGKGELTTSSGDKYIGDFQNGKKHGEGLLIKNNGNKYEGSFKNSKAHGLGKSINISGDKYEGDFIDGKRHGQGVFIDRDGNKYEGEFKDARPYESNESAKQRIHLFWKWIVNYTEGCSRIAVIGHSKLFGRIENDYGILLSRAKFINREFKNCEMVKINFN